MTARIQLIPAVNVAFIDNWRYNFVKLTMYIVCLFRQAEFSSEHKVGCFNSDNIILANLLPNGFLITPIVFLFGLFHWRQNNGII